MFVTRGIVVILIRVLLVRRITVTSVGECSSSRAGCTQQMDHGSLWKGHRLVFKVPYGDFPTAQNLRDALPLDSVGLEV